MSGKGRSRSSSTNKRKNRSGDETTLDQSVKLSKIVAEKNIKPTSSSPDISKYFTSNSATDTVGVDMNDQIIEKIDKLKEEIILSFKEELSELKSILFDLQKEKDELKNLVSRQTTEIEDLKLENKQQKELLMKVYFKQNDLEQYSRRESIRIFGVKEEIGESCIDKVVDLCSSRLNVKVQPQQVEAAHRVGKTLKPDQPRPIIVKFSSRRTRDEVIRARRQLKGSKFVIAEDLTVMNFQTLQKVKVFETVDRAWTTNGKIHALLKNQRRCVIDLSASLELQLQLTGPNFPGPGLDDLNITRILNDGAPKTSTPANAGKKN